MSWSYKGSPKDTCITPNTNWQIGIIVFIFKRLVISLLFLTVYHISPLCEFRCLDLCIKSIDVSPLIWHKGTSTAASLVSLSPSNLEWFAFQTSVTADNLLALCILSLFQSLNTFSKVTFVLSWFLWTRAVEYFLKTGRQLHRGTCRPLIMLTS